MDDFEARVNDITASGEIDKEIIKIAQKNLEVLKTQVEQSGKNQGILKTITTQQRMFQQVTMLPEIKSTYPLVKEQVVVALVGTIESFMGDIFRLVADNAPYIYVWSKPNEKISFDPVLLSRNSFTIGDAVVWHVKAKYSFQDLKSTLDALDEYLGVHLELSDDLRDTLILAAACRHAIVHNKSKADEKFITQVRNTSHSGIYRVGEQIAITDKFIEDLRVTILEFIAVIVVEIADRIEANG